MNTDLLTQLNDYGTYIEDRLPTITSEDVTDRTPSTPIPTYPTLRTKAPRKRLPGWAIAAAATLAVLIVVGGAALLFQDDSPVLDDPVLPTTVPAAPTTPSSSPEVAPTTQSETVPLVISGDPVNGSVIGTTLTGVGMPGDINAGDDWLWVDGASALHRIDPTTLEMTAVPYGRDSDQQRTIAISVNGPWLRDPAFGDVVRIDRDRATLAFEWLFPSDTFYINDLVAGGDALWATADPQVLKLDPETGAVTLRATHEQLNFFNPLVFADGSLWATRWQDRSYVAVRFDSDLQVLAEIEIPNISPGFFWNDQMVSGDGYIFLTGYACTCPDPLDSGDPVGRIVRIDPAANSIITRPVEGVSEYAENLDLGFGPFLDLAFGDGLLWGVRLLEDWGTRDIVRIDPSTLEIVGGPIITEQLPWAIEVAFGRLWITHINNGAITTIDLTDLG